MENTENMDFYILGCFLAFFLNLFLQISRFVIFIILFNNTFSKNIEKVGLFLYPSLRLKKHPPNLLDFDFFRECLIFLFSVLLSWLSLIFSILDFFYHCFSYKEKQKRRIFKLLNSRPLSVDEIRDSLNKLD